MHIIMFDANNWVRARIERDTTGTAPRTIYNEMMTKWITKGMPIVVWDGVGSNNKRRAIYPGYKGGRHKPSESIFAGFKLVSEILKHAPIIQIKMNGYEADDVIANLARSFAEKGDTVEIQSTDYDYMALAHEHPGLITFAGTDKPEVPADMVPYFKVTVGDTSDNIPGIAGFGRKTWHEIDKHLLREYIDRVVAGEDPGLDCLPPRCKPDLRAIRSYWEIIKFIDMDNEEIGRNMLVGTNDQAGANEILKRYMM